MIAAEMMVAEMIAAEMKAEMKAAGIVEAGEIVAAGGYSRTEAVQNSRKSVTWSAVPSASLVTLMLNLKSVC